MARKRQQSKTQRVLNNLREKKQPIGTDIWFPNHSGMKSHREFTQTNLAKGSVTFSDGTIITEDNINFFWDETNNRLGIGTNSPSALLELESSGVTEFDITSTGTSGETWRLQSLNDIANRAGNFEIAEVGASTHLAIQPCGNVGINTLAGGVIGYNPLG